MPQIRKEEVRQRILASAERLFDERSYVETTLAAIAKDAGVSTGNTYVYFQSKVEIFFALFAPWFRAQLDQLEVTAARIRDPGRRLEHILMALWFEIPQSRRGLTNNLVQAISAAKKSQRDFELFWWSSQKLSDLIRPCLPVDRQAVLSGHILCDILLVAFTGYTMNYVVDFPPRRVALAAHLMVDLLRGHEIRVKAIDTKIGFIGGTTVGTRRPRRASSRRS